MDGENYLTTQTADSNGTTSTTRASVGFADKAALAENAKEAEHAAEATHAESAAALDSYDATDERYLSKQKDDRTAGNITVGGGEIVSDDFVSGWDGTGWRAKRGERDEDGATLSMMECDDLRVRGRLVASELVISKVRAICGSLGISQACGKVKSVQYANKNYIVEIEGDAEHGYGGFQKDDFVRCQRWTTSGVRGYWVKVASVDGAYLTIPASEFASNIITGDSGTTFDHVGSPTRLKSDAAALKNSEQYLTATVGTADAPSMVTPAVGDEIVQYGNASDTARQTAIYLHADGVGRPAVDILEGIKSKSFDGCLKCRLGGELPGGGFGLYMVNGSICSEDENGDTSYHFETDGSFGLGFNDEISYNAQDYTLRLSKWVKMEWAENAIAKVSYAVARDAQEGADPSQLCYEETIPHHEETEFVWTRTEFADGSVSYAMGYEGASFVKEWNGTATQISGSSVVSPNLFVGKKNGDKTYTGVFISNDLSDSSTGKTISGIYGVDKSVSRFILDPVRATYQFYGNIFCDEGQIDGLHVGLSMNSVDTITEDDWVDDHAEEPTKPFYLRATSGYYVINYYTAGQVFYISGAPTTMLALELPPYTKAESDNSDYTLGLQLLGRTFYFINKTKQALRIVCNHLNSSGVFLEGTAVTLPIGGTLTAKCCLYKDGRVYWDITSGTAQEIAPTKQLKPSDNPYFKLEKNIQ